jgi:Mg-chelatase subunit ChlI
MKQGDEGIAIVRDVRKRISADFGNDPERLVEHYIKEQEQFRDRIVRSRAAQPADAADRPSADR